MPCPALSPPPGPLEAIASAPASAWFLLVGFALLSAAAILFNLTITRACFGTQLRSSLLARPDGRACALRAARRLPPLLPPHSLVASHRAMEKQRGPVAPEPRVQAAGKGNRSAAQRPDPTPHPHRCLRLRWYRHRHSQRDPVPACAAEQQGSAAEYGGRWPALGTAGCVPNAREASTMDTGRMALDTCATVVGLVAVSLYWRLAWRSLGCVCCA